MVLTQQHFDQNLNPFAILILLFSDFLSLQYPFDISVFFLTQYSNNEACERKGTRQ